MDDLINRQDAINSLEEERCPCESEYDQGYLSMLDKAIWIIKEWLPSAQPEQRYTKKELMVFRHGISLSLLSKRSAQHWRYDEDTATEIEFLERLYEKVGADIRGSDDEYEETVRV